MTKMIKDDGATPGVSVMTISHHETSSKDITHTRQTYDVAIIHIYVNVNRKVASSRSATALVG